VLPAENRLRRRREFTTAVRQGRRAGRPSLVVHLYRSSATPTYVDLATPAPRVGIAVGRTVGPAVVRNRVKRRLRHVLRDRMAALPPGALLVVRALPGSATASSADLAADLDRALARVLNQESQKGAS
jgi:ribonuclease P protein component